MSGVLHEFSQNRIFLTVLMAWMLAQTIKVALGVIQQRRFDFRWLLSTGGMPSTHAAGVSALAVAVGLTVGFHSAFFAITAVFAVITLFDAQGVRRSSGRQAVVLNRIIGDIYFKRGVREDRLKELLGHTPFQVLAGMALGIVVALVCQP